jgi:imidazole glycerol-phosphate synthase subunit HisH
MKIAIVDYGAGNIWSVQLALQRLGVESFLTSSADELLAADKVIFPGVGEASSAMQQLRNTGLDRIIPKLECPVLGICLGMQLMCRFSEEGNTSGLGIFPVDVKRFTTEVKVPHMGWNTITNLKTPLFNGSQESEYMYLVHSYYAPIAPETIAVCDYGQSFSAALHKNNFYGVQFHPEKSGAMGARVLENFLKL